MSLQALTRPSDGEPEGALVLLHGRGADEHDLYGLLDALDPDRRFVGFTARGPLSLPPGGAHWYQLGGLGTPDAETFLPTVDLLSEFLDGLPVPAERVILGGFSQGAVMSYALGLGRGRPRPAAILAFSGFIPRAEGFELDLEPPFPEIVIAHGTYDTVIPVEFGHEARDLLTAAGAEVLYKESPMPHTIDPSVVDELAGRLRQLSSTA